MEHVDEAHLAEVFRDCVMSTIHTWVDEHHAWEDEFASGVITEEEWEWITKRLYVHSVEIGERP